MSIKHIFILSVFFLFVKSGMTQTAQTPTFNSVQEREAWVKAHPVNPADSTVDVKTTTTAGTTTQSSTDSGFPVYVNTGNKEKDDADYAAAKATWVAQHPGSTATTSTVATTENTQAKAPQPSTEPGFPVYVNTGNPEKDAADYAAAKAAWIAQHPDKYAEMTGKPKQ